MNTVTNKYLYANAENLGSGLIISNSHLPIIARIIQYKSLEEMITQLKNKPPLAYSQFPGYSIALIYAGIIGLGNRFIGNKETLEQIQTTLNEMRDWYYDWRISKHEPVYKRYRI